MNGKYAMKRMNITEAQMREKINQKEKNSSTIGVTTTIMKT